MFEDVVKHASNQREEIDELRRQLQEANKQIVESNAAASRSLGECVSNEQQATQQDHDHLLKQIKALMDESAKQKEIRLNGHVDKARSRLTSSRSEFERSNRVYEEGMSQWSDRERSFVSEVIQSKESLKNRVKQDWTVSHVWAETSGFRRS